MKNYGKYSVLSSIFFTESIEEWNGIEKLIEILKLEINCDNFN